jgi:hypothetical protein
MTTIQRVAVNGASRGVPFMLLAVLSSFHLGLRAVAASYCVEGSLTYRVPGYSTLRRQFEVEVTNCLWSISIILVDNKYHISTRKQYDGTNTIDFFSTGQFGRDVGNGLIESGNVPRETTTDGTLYIWLAYSSGCYFHGREEGSAMDFQELRSPSGLTKRYEVPADWTCCADEPYLPLEVVYHASNLGEALDDTGALKVLPLPADAELAHGFIKGQFRAFDLKRFRNVLIPGAFQYVSYGPRRERRGGWRLATNAIVSGIATNIGPFRGFSPLPASLNLEDRRVPDPLVLYKVTNGLIPKLHSPLLAAARARGLQIFKDQLRAQRLRSGGIELRRSVAVILVLLLTLLPPAIYGLVGWRQRRK